MVIDHKAHQMNRNNNLRIISKATKHEPASMKLLKRRKRNTITAKVHHRTANQLERLSWRWLVAVTACAILPTTVLPFIYLDIFPADNNLIEVHGVWLVVLGFGTVGLGSYLQALANRWKSPTGQWFGSAGTLISLFGWALGFLFSIFFALESAPASHQSMYAALTVGWLMPLIISLGVFIAECKRKFFD